VSHPFEAFHLPGGPGNGPMATLEARRLSCRYPVPTADLLERTIRDLRAAGEELAQRPVDTIVDAIDAAAARLADPGDPLRREADRLLPPATGYSAAMASLVLDRMVVDWRGDALRRMLQRELGDVAALDRFVDTGDARRSRAYGPRLAFHIFAGNVPGVAVTSLVRSLLAKGPALGKTAAGEPVLPVLFARALASVDDLLARALAVTYWPGGHHDAEHRVLSEADVIVVYGGEATVGSVRERSPAAARIVLHGPRFSAGMITAAAWDREGSALARAIAFAVATFDQHGCVSPHAVWLEDPDGSRAGPFASALARAMAEAEQALPRGQLDPAEAAVIQQERGAAELRGHAGGGVQVIAGTGTSWTIVVQDDARFRPSCLNRFVHVHPVASLDPAVASLAEHGGMLQSVALAAPPDQVETLAHRLASIGATRVTTFDRLPWPPSEWHHDGRGPLAELLRWVDLEG
jgi:hypothetical protein